jgi:phosphatidate cytidylyltransferase
MSHDPPGIERHVGAPMTEFADAAKQAVQVANKRAGRDLVAATVVGLGLLAVAGGSLLWFPLGFAVFAAALAAGAQIEMGQALGRRAGIKVAFVPLITGSVVLVVGAYVTQVWRVVEPSWFLLGTLGLIIVVVLVQRLVGPLQGYVADVTATLFLLAYPGVLITALMFLLAYPGGPAMVATVILGVAGSDTGGLLLGMLLGRHPFSPRISPKKTWEGLLGSFLLTCVGVIPMTIFLIGGQWWKGAILAVVLVVVGTAGDLVESVIKRDLGLKDMGQALRGHGGIMDRLDSYILVALPALLTLVVLFPHA